MVKFYEANSTFFYSWDQLAKAFWNRYPNPFSTHVLSEDKLYREVRGDQLYSRRLLTKTNRLPRWGERFVTSSANQVSIVEESYINPVNKTITTYTRNIGFTRIMRGGESDLHPDPDNPTQTIAVRSAWIDSNMYGFRRAIESFGLERFRKNCSQAVQGFNFVLSRLYPPRLSTDLDLPGTSVQTTAAGRLGEAKEKMKEKARRAGEMAKGTISSVYAASTGPGSNS